MEKALRLSSQKFFDSENDLLCITKDFKDFNFVSEKWFSTLGWTPAELKPMSISTLIHPDDQAKTLEMFELAKNKTQIFSFENRFVTKNKVIKWFEWRIFSEGLTDPTFMLVGREITTAKTTAHHFKLTQTHAALGTWTFQSGTEAFTCSDELYEIYEIDSTAGLSYAQNASFYDVANWSKINAAFMDCLEKGDPWNLEVELITARDKLKWVQSWGFPIRLGNEIIGVEGMIQDLTPRKNEELILKQTLEELNKIQLSINQHCLVARINPLGFFMDVNQVFEKTSGYRLPEFIGKQFTELTNQYETNVRLEDIISILRNGEKWRGEIRLKTKTEGSFWVDMSMTPIMDQSRIILSEIVCIGYDITEKKLNDERYKALVSGINAGIWDWPDISKEDLFWSPKFYELADYKPGEFAPSAPKFEALIHPDDVHSVLEKVAHALAQEPNFMVEYRFLCGSGKYKWLQSLGIILRDEYGKPYRMIGSCTDVNQKKLVEFNLEEEKQKTIQNSKLATLGEMAAGLAHEVNNPLTIIFGYIRVLEEELSEGKINLEVFNRYVGLIKNAAQRAAKVVTNLKDFARDGSTDPFVDLPASELISVVLDLCHERFMKNGIRVDVEIKNDPNVRCRKIELSQVLLNLLFNSFDALGEAAEKEKWVRIMVQELPQFIEISIMDSGMGLPTGVAEKVFTPFFTTKKVGQGTGIGLSISQRIVLNHGGEIFYDATSPNTKFILRLPFHEKL